MKIFLISLTIGFQQGNSHCVPSSAPWEMVKWPFTIASLSFMLPTMRALVNILGFYWINLSDTPQTVTYASKEAAESPFYDYLSVYSGRIKYNAVLNYNASMDFRRFPYGKLKNSIFFLNSINIEVVPRICTKI